MISKRTRGGRRVRRACVKYAEGKIEADRAETQRMMQELLQMKAQMAQSNGGETPKADETPSDTTTV